jgi:hypothetical protein
VATLKDLIAVFSGGSVLDEVRNSLVASGGFLESPRYGRAALGQYFRATNGTFGTGTGMSIVTTFVATSPLLTIVNGAPAGGPSIYVDYIKLMNTVAGATTTQAHIGTVLDLANRYSSGGAALTGAPVNSGSKAAPIASINFGAIVATAASASVRLLGRDIIKTQAAPCWVVGDEVFIKCENVDTPAGATNGAGTAIYPAPMGPVIIAPGHTFLLYMWNVANATTAPSWEVEVAWWERP